MFENGGHFFLSFICYIVFSFVNSLYKHGSILSYLHNFLWSLIDIHPVACYIGLYATNRKHSLH